MRENRTRTERDESRDRPGDEMVRLSVAEAAHRLGISEAGVRKLVQREQIPYERDDGRLFVWVSPGETRHAESRDQADTSRDAATMVEEVRDRLRYVEGQLEAERQAHGETRRLLLSALEKIPPAIEPPSERSEPRESPESAAGDMIEPTPSEPWSSAPRPEEALGGPRSGTARGSWWRRMFGG